VKRVTRSMTGFVSRKQYATVRDNKSSSCPSSDSSARSSIFKLGELRVMFQAVCFAAFDGML